MSRTLLTTLPWRSGNRIPCIHMSPVMTRNFNRYTAKSQTYRQASRTFSLTRSLSSVAVDSTNVSSPIPLDSREEKVTKIEERLLNLMKSKRTAEAFAFAHQCQENSVPVGAAAHSALLRLGAKARNHAVVVDFGDVLVRSGRDDCVTVTGTFTRTREVCVFGNQYCRN